MKKILANGLNGNLRIIEETLTDDSKVYNLEIGSFEYPCSDLKDAERRYSQVINATDYQD